VLDAQAVMKKKIQDAIRSAMLEATPTVPRYDVAVEDGAPKLKPLEPAPPSIDEKLIAAIASGVATVVLEEFSNAVIVFPPPGLKALVGPAIGEVQGTGKIE
jgi:hypothetical protein